MLQLGIVVQAPAQAPPQAGGPAACRLVAREQIRWAGELGVRLDEFAGSDCTELVGAGKHTLEVDLEEFEHMEADFNGILRAALISGANEALLAIL